MTNDRPTNCPHQRVFRVRSEYEIGDPPGSRTSKFRQIALSPYTSHIDRTKLSMNDQLTWRLDQLNVRPELNSVFCGRTFDGLWPFSKQSIPQFSDSISTDNNSTLFNQIIVCKFNLWFKMLQWKWNLILKKGREINSRQFSPLLCFEFPLRSITSFFTQGQGGTRTPTESVAPYPAGSLVAGRAFSAWRRTTRWYIFNYLHPRSCIARWL